MALSLVEEVLEHNREQSALFSSREARDEREDYRTKHSTEIGVLKCMDGRMSLAVFTETPLGIIQPFRDLGARFEFGSPHFDHVMKRWVYRARRKNRCVIPLVCDHWSQGDRGRCCKGHGYDTAKARAYASELRDRFAWHFAEHHPFVYPIHIRIETDEDALTFYGARDGNDLNLSQTPTTTPASVIDLRLREMYPDMREEMLLDLVPLVMGNLRHVAKMREQPRRPEDMQHREQVFALGRDFDWMRRSNWAVIVGPYSMDIAASIKTGAELILENLREGRIAPSEGVVLMTSGIYKKRDLTSQRFAESRSRRLEHIATSIIRAQVPKLGPYVTVLPGVTDMKTRRFTPLDGGAYRLIA